jgi:hypothetical protein
MASEDDETEFGRKLKEHRIQAGLSIVQAAERAGLGRSRWSQYEAGFSTGAAGKVPARPFAHNVGPIAAAVNWDRDEALRVAGYDPADYPPDPEVTVEPVPRVIVEGWSKLTPKWRELITNLVVEALKGMPRPDGRTFPAPVADTVNVGSEEPLFSHAKTRTNS